MITSRKDLKTVYTHEVQGNCTITNVEHFSEIRTQGILDFDVYLPTLGVNLQRGYVWTLEQKQAFIMALIRVDSTAEIPPITIINNYMRKPVSKNGEKLRYDYTIEVIDGKQRLSTAIDFYDNVFPIVWQGVEYFYKDLPRDIQSHLGFSCMFRATIHYCDNYSGKKNVITDETKIKIFKEVNWAGTPQDFQHMQQLENLIGK